MKRKRPKKVKKYSGKTEKEWRDWGEKFGKRMEKRGKNFSEEMEFFADRCGEHMDRKSKKWEDKCKDWWSTTFGFIGPLIGSIIGIIFIGIGILLLNFINLLLDSSFIASVSNFLFRNLPLFFGLFLFFGYNDYFSKRYYKIFWVVSPITTAIGIVIVLWIGVWVLNLVNTTLESGFITSVANFLSVNLLGIFFVLLVLGYVIVFIKIIIKPIGGF